MRIKILYIVGMNLLFFLSFVLFSNITHAQETKLIVANPDTLQESRRLARQAIQAGSSVVLELSEGTYYLNSTWVIDKSDRPAKGRTFTIRGKLGSRVVLSGGLRLPRTIVAGSGIQSIPLPSNLSRFRQIYVENSGDLLSVRAQRARTKNFAISRFQQNASSPTALDRFLEFQSTMPYVENKSTTNPLEAVYIRFWTENRFPVEKITQTGTQNLVYPRADIAERELGKTSPSLKVGQVIYLENDPTFIDQELEWFHDEDKSVLNILAESQESHGADITIPQLETLMTISDVSSVVIENLIFKHTTWNLATKDGLTGYQSTFFTKGINNVTPTMAALKIARTEGVQILRNRFEQLGGSAIELIEGTRNTLIKRNIIDKISGSGIQVFTSIGEIKWDAQNRPYNVEMNNPALVCSGDEITENRIFNVGLDYSSSVGIIATYPEKIIISKNEVAYVPYSGISLGWGWTSLPSSLTGNLIELNHVHHVMQKLNDGGAIYTLSNQRGTIIRNNLITDLSYGSLTQGSEHHAGRPPVVPLYLDNNSEGITLENNYCSRTERISDTEFGLFYRPEVLGLNKVQQCKTGIPSFKAGVPE